MFKKLIVSVLIISATAALHGTAFGHTPIHLAQAAQSNQQDKLVDYNTNSGKYHNPNCRWAIRCTRNCIRIPKSQAIKKGGIPCKVCGGR